MPPENDDTTKAPDAPETEAQKPIVDESQQPLRMQSRRRLMPRVGPGNEPAAAVGPEDALSDPDEQTVNMIFPREVTLTDDGHKRIKFPIGLVAVPAHLADHWYLAANGVRKQGEAKKPVADE